MQTHKHTGVPELAAERGDLSHHALAAVGELLHLSLQLPLLGVGARVVLFHLLQLPLQLLQAHHRFIQLGGGRGERRREEEKDGAYRRGRGETRDRRKEGNKKRRGQIYMKRQISLGPGGLIGIRSQIKPSRLSPMMFWEESQCLCWG